MIYSGYPISFWYNSEGDIVMWETYVEHHGEPIPVEGQFAFGDKSSVPVKEGLTEIVTDYLKGKGIPDYVKLLSYTVDLT